MSHIIVPPRTASIGSFDVSRSIPWRHKRMCGPFIFLDHMGPVTAQGHDGDVLPHPHIGLNTLTWLFSGQLVHRDSLGTVQTISPGDVNWMTAGRGIVHSERMPDDVETQTLEGLQLWIALPKEKQSIAPTFQHIAAHDIPVWEEEGLHFKLIAGEWGEYQSPLTTHCDTLMVELTADHQGEMDLDFEPGNEIGIYLIEGDIELHLDEDTPLEPKHLFISDAAIQFSYSDDAKFILLGGEAFNEVPLMYWNFVAFDQDTLEEAKQRWVDQSFDAIPGETEFVPLPK